MAETVCPLVVFQLIQAWPAYTRQVPGEGNALFFPGAKRRGNSVLHAALTYCCLFCKEMCILRPEGKSPRELNPEWEYSVCRG